MIRFKSKSAGAAGKVVAEPVGRVNVVRSIAMPDGSRISVVRKDIMDHALGRDRPAKA